MVGFGLNSCKQIPTSLRLEDVVCVELDVRKAAINDSDSITRRISRYIGVEKKDVVHLQALNVFFFFGSDMMEGPLMNLEFIGSI